MQNIIWKGILTCFSVNSKQVIQPLNYCHSYCKEKLFFNSSQFFVKKCYFRRMHDKSYQHFSLVDRWGYSDCASSCTRGRLNWTAGKIPLQKEQSSIAKAAQGSGWVSTPGSISQICRLCCLGIWFSAGLGVGLDLIGLFQPKWFCDSYCRTCF